MKKRKPSKLESEARVYHDVLLAINRYFCQPFVSQSDVQRVLAAVVARWFGYKLKMTIEPPA